MRTPITYYGGKQRLADTIISMIPGHKLYCEPFFGGGAVFFRKPKTGLEVINDHNDMLINFYLAAQNSFPELQERIRNTLHSETMYYHAKDVWNGSCEANEIEKAWAVWLITNGSFAGSMHGGWKWCNGTSGSHSGIYMNNKRIEFNEALKNRLECVQISCRDALKVITERDSENTFFYLDPPYPGSYQGHYKGYSLDDLEELLELLSGIKGKFILSNYWSDLLSKYIDRNKWNYKQIEMDLKVNHLGKGAKIGKRTEILVYNYTIQQSLFNNQ